MKIKALYLAILLSLSMASVSFGQESRIPDYSSTPRKDVPEKFKWKISDIYPSAAAWEADKAKYSELLSKIVTDSKSWTQSAPKMLAMLKQIDVLRLKMQHLDNYPRRQFDMDMGNSQLAAMKGQAEQLQVETNMKLTFINDDILKMDEKKLKGYFAKEPGLGIYKFSIDEIMRSKKHILPLAQEQLVSLSGMFSGKTAEACRILNDVDMPAPSITLSNGQKVDLNYATYYRYRTSPNPEDRSKAMRAFFENQKKYENTFAALLDGGVKVDYFNAKSHLFNSCLQARLFTDNIDTSVYYTLLNSVKQNLEPLHRYMKLKAEMLGIEKMKYEDVYASAVKRVKKEFTYEEAQSIIINSLNVLGSDYTDQLKKAFNEGWIDVYPNKDKQSGAYSGGIYDIHPFVKMNFDGSYSNVSTLTHELGHSLHSYLSDKTQPYVNSGYTTFMAEIASTFNENMLMDYLLKNETDDMFKLFIIDNYLERARATIYRQTLFADFELQMHQRVEEGKALTSEWLDEKYLELTRKFYGHDKGVVQVDDYIQCEWSLIEHFYLNFYVFQYSTGMISSMALTQNVLDGKKDAVNKYLTMLKSGNSDFSIKLLQNAGIDMTKTEPYIAALKRFESLVTEMEKIVAKLKKEGKGL